MTIEERKQFEKDLQDIEVRQFHADALNRIFRGTIGYITEDQITPEVAKASQFLESEILKNERILKILLYGIQTVTIGLFIGKIAMLYREKRHFTGSIFALLKKEDNWTALINSGLRAKYDTILLSAYSKNRIVKAVVDKVNVNWKSQMGLLLSGFIDELSYY